MKNVMLIGVSRSGKTTFAKMLKKKYPEYNIIHGDMIKKSFEKNIDNSKKLKDIKEYRSFIKDYFLYEHTINDINYIIDTVDIFPCDITEEDKNNTIIIAFGYSNITEDQLIDIWKNIDNDWLKNKDDEFLFKKAKKGLEKSKYFEMECKKYNIKYVDTSKNRALILDELLKNI